MLTFGCVANCAGADDVMCVHLISIDQEKGQAELAFCRTYVHEYGLITS